MTIRRFTVPATLSSGGAAELYTPDLYGELVSIRYVKGNFADTVDFVITANSTGETLWSEENVTASKSCYPRAATHSTAGAAALYASGGVAVLDRVALGGDKVKIVIANGGNATTGTFYVTIDG